MGVLLKEGQEGIQVYQPADGPLAGQTFYGAHRIVCTDPTCPSTDMVFALRKHPDGETFEIIIDVRNRTISPVKATGRLAADSRLAEAFVSHLSDAHWNVLYHDLLRQREALLEDATALESANFDFTDLEYSIEHESAMVFFDTVFPFGRPFDLEVRGARVTLIDQYCLNSRCTCTDVVLSAIPAFGTVDQTDDGPIQPLFTVSHNYQTHTATVIDDSVAGSGGTADGRSAELYLKAPKADLKRISSLVRKRHRMMRRIYRTYRDRTGAEGDRNHGRTTDTVTPPDGKVGRNQPCPCGSGRKYKHCCGR
jgi:hypothetical protein